MMILAELLEGLAYHVDQGSLAQPITGVTSDSRKVQAGWAFVAIRGAKLDGHRFIGQAVRQGAAAIIRDQAATAPLPAHLPCVSVVDARRALAHLAATFSGYPSRQLSLIGVTGTNGKTTSTYLLEAMGRAQGLVPGVIGTVSYRYGDCEHPAEQTTPGPENLQQLLREMVDAGVSHCVMEVSSHALAQERVWGCQFAAALFTNLSQDHLDFHADMQEYYAAKARLFREYQPGVAVVNGDDPSGKRLLTETRAPILTYGFSSEADVGVENVQLGTKGTNLTVRVRQQVIAIRSPLVGRHNVYNVLGVVAVAHGLGWELDQAIGGIEALAAVPGRFERIDEGQPFVVLVDYAHTPDALRNVLTAARDVTSGRLLVVFGAGGDRDRSKRPAMGRVAAEYADVALITSDNPRTEAPMEIISAIEAGYRAAAGQGVCHIVEDRSQAIDNAIDLARAGDVVVIAGKGHETYQIIGERRYAFDDRQVVRQALQVRGFAPAITTNR